MNVSNANLVGADVAKVGDLVLDGLFDPLLAAAHDQVGRDSEAPEG